MSTPVPSPSSALQLGEIEFSYPTRSNGINGVLYKDFSLRIEQGSIVTIMGASGSGKSTLGRIMAGILTPRSGLVRRSPDFTHPSDVVYVDQHPMNGVFPWQTVLENVRYPLEKLNWKGTERRDRICYLMTLFRLGALADVYPAQLSGGELQRLALSRCLSWKPKLVILDEPFSALDGKVKAEITSALHELAIRDRITLVLITHNVSDALALGMRCVVIAKRPVRVISDLDFRTGFPRNESAPDYEAMQQALINGIRDGLV
ncbi:MAG TPA: ATP-binding cassette domain-containing protein [Terriglobales bacterium]|jgi:NitT/TauT family transport system ATP-binding protein|nr:ATP-binding cassette domain-containing protein [Terriglobales bacterium]